MLKSLNTTLFVLFVLAFQKGYSSDSTYIAIHWNGETDKPHNSFIFHRKNVEYNPLNMHFENPFNIYVELNDSSFALLKNLLFEFQEPTTTDKTYRLYMAYYVGYFDGDKWILNRSLYSESDYIAIYRILSTFLKGTKYEKDFHYRWTTERTGLPIGLRTIENEPVRTTAHNIGFGAILCVLARPYIKRGALGGPRRKFS